MPILEKRFKRLTGVFVLEIDKHYLGPPLALGDYFSSSLKAPRYIGFKTDSIARGIRKRALKGGDPNITKKGVGFRRASEMYVWTGYFQRAMLRQFPEWFIRPTPPKWVPPLDYQI